MQHVKYDIKPLMAMFLETFTEAVNFQLETNLSLIASDSHKTSYYYVSEERSLRTWHIKAIWLISKIIKFI